jgi:hypothetical protein
MEKYIPFLLQLQTQTQLWHWQTATYASHVALGSYYESIQELSDRFIEVTKGKNPNGGTPELQQASIEIKGIVSVDLVQQYSAWANQLIEFSKEKEMCDYLEIQDIILDMINATHQLVYLLRLK